MDQYNNTVDGEIRIPLKDFHTSTEWTPLGKNSWIEQPQRWLTGAAPVPAMGTTATEWALAYANGTVDEAVFTNEGAARMELQNIRSILKNYGVPEDAWPILMERTVETVASSWRILSV